MLVIVRLRLRVQVVREEKRCHDGERCPDRRLQPFALSARLHRNAIDLSTRQRIFLTASNPGDRTYPLFHLVGPFLTARILSACSQRPSPATVVRIYPGAGKIISWREPIMKKRLFFCLFAMLLS